jgi:hypothetical protein
MPGSALTFPGEYTSRASGFASGKPLDAAPGHPVLAQLAAEAAGDGDRYAGASDDELLGVIGGWDRVESHASARKHAAIGELLRRRPAGTGPGHGESGRPAGATLAGQPGTASRVTAVTLATAATAAHATARLWLRRGRWAGCSRLGSPGGPA